MAGVHPALAAVQHHPVKALLRLPAPLQRALADSRLRHAGGEEVLAELQLLLTLRRLAGGRPMHQLDPARARRKLREEVAISDGPKPAVGAVRDLTIAGGLAARHYTPLEPSDALLVYYHGGGFVIGDLETHDLACRILCREAGTGVLAVDYRLAPEHPFPAAVEDAAAALSWAAEHAGELGADPARIAVGGDSAGGNLAAVTAQAAARGELPPVAAQLLIYPVTDFDGEWPSHEPFNHGYLLDLEERRWFQRHHLGGTGVDRADPRLSPIRAGDLAGVAPAVVITCALDPLRDEGEAYARRLEEAGVAVTGLRLHGQVHGFLHLIGLSPASRWATVTLARRLRERLGPAPGGPSSPTPPRARPAPARTG
jgi:acetyl esterase